MLHHLDLETKSVDVTEKARLFVSCIAMFRDIGNDVLSPDLPENDTDRPVVPTLVEL